MQDQFHQYWEQIREHGEIAIHIAGQFPDLKLELWQING